MAPGASIVLVEANSDNFSDLMAAVNTARELSGVSVVSMSFGWREAALDSANGTGSELSSDATFTTPTGHQGVTFVAATGDYGSPGDYPAFSPNVLAVGGTSLYTSGGSYSYEYRWSSSGYGASNYEPEPNFQAGVQSSASRQAPDVSFDANPNTGVAIYDSYDFGSSAPWSMIGGTSLGTPMGGPGGHRRPGPRLARLGVARRRLTNAAGPLCLAAGRFPHHKRLLRGLQRGHRPGIARGQQVGARSGIARGTRPDHRDERGRIGRRHVWRHGRPHGLTLVQRRRGFQRDGQFQR